MSVCKYYMYINSSTSGDFYTKGKVYEYLGERTEGEGIRLTDNEGAKSNGGKGHYWGYESLARNFRPINTISKLAKILYEE